MASSEESVVDKNRALHLHVRRRRTLQWHDQCVLGTGPSNPAISEEDLILEPVSSPLAIFLRDTFKTITEELPKRTSIVSDNPRMHGDRFGKDHPITLPVLDDYTALDGFMTNLLQERQISASNTTILNDNACSGIRRDETPPFFNESLSADSAFFDVEAGNGEPSIPHLSIFGRTSASSRMVESFSALELEEDIRPQILEKVTAVFESFSGLDLDKAPQPHILENVTAILRQEPRLSDFFENTTRHDDLEDIDDQELTLSGENSVFQQSFHTVQEPYEEIDLGKDISPTGVMDHPFLHAPPTLQKITDKLFDLEESGRETNAD